MKIKIFVLLVIILCSLGSSYAKQEPDGILNINPNVACLNAEYSLTFTQQNRLEKDGFIFISFPSGIILPEELHKEFVTINDKSIYNVERNAQDIGITTAFDIAGGSEVTIKFLKEFGIINPTKPGYVKLNFRPRGCCQLLSSSEVQIVPLDTERLRRILMLLLQLLRGLP